MNGKRQPRGDSAAHGLDGAAQSAPEALAVAAGDHAVIDGYLIGVAKAIESLSRGEIAHAGDILVRACGAGRRVFVCGNGGSASTASHMVNDLNKQAAVDGAPRMRAISLNDNVPLLTAWSNDLDFAECFARQLANYVEAGDVLVGISTSGNSENVLRAVQAANEAGAATIGFTGDDGGRLRSAVDCCVHVPSSDIGQQEDCHLVLNHVLAQVVRRRMRLELENGSVQKPFAAGRKVDGLTA